MIEEEKVGSVSTGAWTPGPWECEHRERPSDGMWYTEVFTPDGGTGHGRIATLDWYPKPIDARGAIGTYREANARLIAASPTMAEYIQRKADEGDEEARRIMEAAHACR